MKVESLSALLTSSGMYHMRYKALIILGLFYCVFRYEWLKNGVPLPHSSNVMFHASGDVEINPLGSFDEGYYQCRAVNQYGVALSNVTVLRRAVLQSYGGTAVVQELDGFEGQPFKINYVPTKCEPRALFTWGTAPGIVAASNPQSSMSIVPTTTRIQVDDDGN